MTKYAVISVGCTECGTTSDPATMLVTDDFAEASAAAREIADVSGSQGDGFVVRLDDGAIVAWDPDGGYNTWREDLFAKPEPRS